MSRIVFASAVVVALCAFSGVAQAFTVPAHGEWHGQGIHIYNDTDQPMEVHAEMDGPPNPPDTKWFLEIIVPEGAQGHVEVNDENNTEGDGDTAILFEDNRDPPDSAVYGGGLGHGNGQSCDRVNGVDVGIPH